MAEPAGKTQADAPRTMSVVVEGGIPGFTQEQLATYLCEEMTAAHAASWQFTPASAADSSPNRIVWHFKLLPYAGGTVKYIGPALSHVESAFGARRAIGIDAKIYLDGQYQNSSFDQANIKGAKSDPSLDAAIQKIMRAIIANATASDLMPDAKPRALAGFFGSAASETDRRS